jgi:hypothetical protein
MNCLEALAILTLALALGAPVIAQVQPDIELQVSPHMDIYRAGGYNDGSDGIAPAIYTFPARPFQTLTFSSVSGSWTCAGGVAEYGADGTTTGPCFHAGGQKINSPTGPFSGYGLTDFVGGMAGVFLEDNLPSSAAPPLRFYVSDNSQGGTRTDFKSLNPKIGQVFFIGDGLTGTGIGSIQVFQVPPTATNLYLGYVDSCSQPGPATPGCYSDNAGALTVIFRIQDHELNWINPGVSSPPGRCCMGIAYDPAMRSTVMFGGFTNPSYLNDTWTWVLRRGWTRLSPAAAPSPRQGPGMVWDGAAGNVVLFGGVDANGTPLNDTWTWDGTTWTQQFPTVSPSGRRFDTQNMAYDAVTRTVMIFGGLAANNSVLGDTWLWDGLAKTWAQQFPATSPSPRRTMMAYDIATKTVVLFGGDNGTTDHYNDTWTWDGTTWTQQFPPSAPSVRGMASMAYDPTLGSVILFGGADTQAGSQSNDTWVWNGINWAQIHPATLPTARWAAGMDYDPTARSLVLFAGFGTHTLDDTWLFSWIR